MFKWFFCVLVLYSSSVLSDGVKFKGNLYLRPSSILLQNQNPSPIITLMAIDNTKHIQSKFLHNMKLAISESFKQMRETRLPVAIDLGMEDVPVLNQGIHGSCVVFAISAAIDALLKAGDYVSVLCNLQLGEYLQTYGYSSSGWDGGLGVSILPLYERFGFMNKSKQHEFGCGGLVDYPVLQKEHGTGMSPEDFYLHSEALSKHHIAWSNLLDTYQSIYDDVDASQVLQQVKKSLSSGDRLIFGILLADYEKGLAGAVGTHKAFNDTWVITPEIIDDLKLNPQFAGHEMLLIGYDDYAVAKDEHGRSHRGLLKVRNSWGDKIGDHGDFYVSYDYFKALVIELQRIRQLT